MNLDDIAQKRAELQQKKVVSDSHKENIDAVTNSSKKVVDATASLAKSEDIDSVIKQLKEIQLTTLLNARSNVPEKSTVILTDQTDLGDKISELTTAIKSLDSSEMDAKQLQAIKNLQKIIEIKDNTRNQEALLKAIQNIKVDPIVNVPKPNITVQPTPIDLTQLQNVIKEYVKPREVLDNNTSLENYRAQDIDNTNQKVQYVGFLNPSGAWYIIENDVSNNRMRYMFGTNGYEKAFSKAATYSYNLLNEALDAVAT